MKKEIQKINSIEEYKEITGRVRVNWKKVSRFRYLSEEFIERYKDKVEWDLISKSQKLSEEFIEKYKDKVDW
ncbi:MAG: hypothetical protein ACK4WJ_06195, partial [Endomicrobiia bacterium]